MALTFKHDCPHCGTKHSGFTFRSEYARPKLRSGDMPWNVSCSCGHCEETVVFVVFAGVSGAPSVNMDSSPEYFRVMETYPKPQTPDAPDHLPSNILRFFEQATDNLTRNYDAAGMMYRKCIEAAFKNKFPDYTGSQFQRINKAVENGELTTDLGEWAHQIRLDGNSAVHDDDPFTKQQAEDLHAFSEVVLMYLFTLPEMLRTRRAASEVENEE